LIITVARGERVVLGTVRDVVCTANKVVDVLAEIGSMSPSGVAGFEAELAPAHKVVPLGDLLESGVVTAPGGRVYKAPDGITTKISTVRIQFSS